MAGGVISIAVDLLASRPQRAPYSDQALKMQIEFKLSRDWAYYANCTVLQHHTTVLLFLKLFGASGLLYYWTISE